MHYTWPSPHNQSSKKAKLPMEMKKAIKDVATYTLRGRAETWEKLERKIMILFSSRRKAVSLRCRSQYVYQNMLALLDLLIFPHGSSLRRRRRR